MRSGNGVLIAVVSSLIVTLAGCQTTTTTKTPPAKDVVALSGGWEVK
jgi:hypothetical protein